MIQIQQYNITAQAYKKTDPYKQTLLINEVISAENEENAQLAFEGTVGIGYNIVKIYSVTLEK